MLVSETLANISKWNFFNFPITGHSGGGRERGEFKILYELYNKLLKKLFQKFIQKKNLENA